MGGFRLGLRRRDPLVCAVLRDLRSVGNRLAVRPHEVRDRLNPVVAQPVGIRRTETLDGFELFVGLIVSAGVLLGLDRCVGDLDLCLLCGLLGGLGALGGRFDGHFGRFLGRLCGLLGLLLDHLSDLLTLLDALDSLLLGVLLSVEECFDGLLDEFFLLGAQLLKALDKLGLKLVPRFALDRVELLELLFEGRTELLIVERLGDSVVLSVEQLLSERGALLVLDVEQLLGLVCGLYKLLVGCLLDLLVIERGLEGLVLCVEEVLGQLGALLLGRALGTDAVAQERLERVLLELEALLEELLALVDRLTLELEGCLDGCDYVRHSSVM